jgi:DNA-binding protein WhiA
MAMTAAVKDELSRISVTKPCCRKAEVSSLLRFAGGLHIAAGKILIEVELDTSQSARRLRKDIADIYGHGSDLAVGFVKARAMLFVSSKLEMHLHDKQV